MAKKKAVKKTAKKKPAPKPKSKPRSSGKKQQKGLPKKKKPKSTKSKKSLRVVSSKAKKVAKKVVKKATKKVAKKVAKKATKKTPTPKVLATANYKLVTLDPKTKRKITPKRGQEVFYAWQGPRGKLEMLTDKFSQPYYPSDAAGILKAFKQGDPQAFVVYSQLTRQVDYTIDEKGKKVPTYKKGKDGKPVKKYRQKLTGRKLRQKQRPSVHSVKGFETPLGLGFHSYEEKEIPKGGFITVPVQSPSRKTVLPKLTPKLIGPFVGDTIRDTIERLRPSMDLPYMIKHHISGIGVSGFVMLYRPKNPYKTGTPEHAEREAWARQVWKDGEERRINVGVAIHKLVNFSKVLSQSIRESMSREGVRVTSAYALRKIEERQFDKDNREFEGAEPIWLKVIKYPPGGPVDRAGEPLKACYGGIDEDKDVPAFTPLRYENEHGVPMHKNNSVYNTRIMLSLALRARKG